MDLRPYQRDAVDAVRRELTKARTTLLVLATGLGKTVTFADIARRVVARGGRVLVLAHRSELLEQAATTLRRFGLSVGIEQGSQRVDPSALPDVVIAAVQTLRGKRLASFAPNAFTFVIVDEAHHATAKSYRAVLDHFGTAKVLGVTATPDRADGVGLRNVFESVAYRMELAAGIQGGWLSPIELRSVRVEALDLSNVRTVAGDLSAGDLERELMRDRVLHEVASPLAELAAGRKALAFVAGVAQAHALADVLEGYGVRAAAVDGSMSAEQRLEVLEGYRSGRFQLVCNAMLWTEGFDAPETSCVAIVRPTRSRSLLVQMIGRGTRLAEGKSSCLVLDFVPGQAARVRLASPADALAGEPLPDDVAELAQRASTADRVELFALIAQAHKDAATRRAELEALALAAAQAESAEATRLVRTVGVAYAAPRLDVARLLAAVSEPDPPNWRPEWTRGACSHSQLAALRTAGLDVPDALTRKDANALFHVLAERRRAGLCSIKQAKKLHGYGLRDDMTAADAREAFEAIAGNGWRPPPWLFGDPRFARIVAA